MFSSIYEYSNCVLVKSSSSKYYINITYIKKRTLAFWAQRCVINLILLNADPKSFMQVSSGPVRCKSCRVILRYPY